MYIINALNVENFTGKFKKIKMEGDYSMLLLLYQTFRFIKFGKFYG